MIICVSLNPAIDRRLVVQRLAVGQVNRARAVKPSPGGKAAHVATVVKALGHNPTWLGFLGGASGADIEQGLSALGITVVPVRTVGQTRNNLEIIDKETGATTEVLEPGGPVSASEQEKMFSLLRKLFQNHAGNAQVVLAGSLPPGVPPSFYARLIHLAHEFGCKVLLDASGPALLHGLEAEPDFVKPNRDEAEVACGFNIYDAASALASARWFIERGAKSAAVSLGADGLVFLAGEHATPLIVEPPKLRARSTVGCGDATVAGLAVAFAEELGAPEAVRLAVACGAANCSAETPGMIDTKEVQRFMSLVQLRG